MSSDTAISFAEATQRPRSRRRFYHWLLFSVSALMGAVPVLGGLAISVAGLIMFARSPESLGLVGLLMAVCLLAISAAAPVLVFLGVKKQDYLYGTCGLLAILLLWPAFTFVGYVLSYMVNS